MIKNNRSFLTKLFLPFYWLFGRFNWQAPPWFKSLAGLWRKVPRLLRWLVSVLVVVILLSVATWHCLQHYWSLTAPVRAEVIVPGIQALDAKQQTQPLLIKFWQSGPGQTQILLNKSVAPLNAVNREVKSGISLSPNIKGAWRWLSDHTLQFKPEGAWPAGQSFKVHIGNSLLIKGTYLADYTLEFETLALQLKINSLRFYVDPKAGQERKAVATLLFNYPVTLAALKQKLQLNWLSATPSSSRETTAIPFTLSVDKSKHNRQIYLHSENLTLPETDQFIQLTLNKGLKAQAGGVGLVKTTNQSLRIPAINSHLAIQSTQIKVIDNRAKQPQKIIVINANLGIKTSELQQHLEAYLLPKYKDSKTTTGAPYRWQRVGEVNTEVLQRSKLLSLVPVKTEHDFNSAQQFQLSAAANRLVYITISKGVTGLGGFVLGNDYHQLLAVPDFPQSINFLRSGMLLSLTGDKSMTIAAKSIPSVRFQASRFLPSALAQLVTQTGGRLEQLNFKWPC